MASNFSLHWRKIRHLFRKPKGSLFIPDPELQIDIHGFPGDKLGQPLELVSTVGKILDAKSITWCVIGHILLGYYGVPKVIHTVEFCVASDDLEKTVSALSSEFADYRLLFRPSLIHNLRHYSKYPRFKVKDRALFFHVVPDTLFRMDPLDSTRIFKPDGAEFKLPDLPYYITSQLKVLEACSKETEPNEDSQRLEGQVLVQMDYLMDGMDIDEEWCRKHLDPACTANWLLDTRVNREQKQKDMGSHYKYRGNLTSLIRDEEQRQRVLAIKGREPVNEDMTICVS